MDDLKLGLGRGRQSQSVNGGEAKKGYCEGRFDNVDTHLEDEAGVVSITFEQNTVV